MTPRIHTLLRWCFVSAFIVVAGAASYFQEIGLLLLPVAIVGAVLLVQYPQLLFCLLLISIPWSVEFNFNTHLATDLPDEPLMLLMSLSVVIWFLYGAKFSGRIHPLLMIILLQLAWTVLTVITSSEPLLSIKFLLAKCWYLLAFMAAPLVLFRDERILRRSAILLLTSMMLCMAVAVFRHYNYHWAFEKINDAVQPFFHNHVNYSALLVFMVPLQLAVIRLTASKNLRFAVLV
ncbi:MAG TPA: hypothetical protein VNR87_07980, partial [Flavisolibacter sp.]|nr:hypothetical protein [Flavisolibacter sp.]